MSNIVREQHVWATNHATTITKVITPGAAGRTIIVVLTSYYSGGGAMGTPPTCSDNVDGAYTLDVGPKRSAGASAQSSVVIFRLSNCTAGIRTITCTPGGAGTPFNNIFVAEYSGLAPSSPVDQTNSANGASGTITSGAITTALTQALLIFGMATNDGSSGLIATPNNSFVQVDFDDDANAAACGGLFDRIIAASGTFTGSVSLNSGAASGWAGAIVSYNASATPLGVSVGDTNAANWADATLNTGYIRQAFSFRDALSMFDGIALVGPPPDYRLTLSDKMNMQDGLTPVGANVVRLFADTINNWSDAVAKAMGIPIQAFDSNMDKWLDAFASLLIAPLSLTASDTLSQSDAVVKALNNVKLNIALADTLNNLADAIRIFFVVRSQVGDNMVMSDSLQMKCANLLRVSDILNTWLDSIGIKVSTRPAFADTMTMSDAVTVRMAGNIRVTVADTVNHYLDAIAKNLVGVYDDRALILRIRRYLGDTN